MGMTAQFQLEELPGVPFRRVCSQDARAFQFQVFRFSLNVALFASLAGIVSAGVAGHSTAETQPEGPRRISVSSAEPDQVASVVGVVFRVPGVSSERWKEKLNSASEPAVSGAGKGITVFSDSFKAKSVAGSKPLVRVSDRHEPSRDLGEGFSVSSDPVVCQATDTPATPPPGFFPGAVALTKAIGGRVYNHRDGSPLMKVEVRVVGSETRTVSDMEGRYRLDYLIQEECDLSFSLAGFRTVTVTALKPGAKADPVDVALVPGSDSSDVVTLSAVTVSGGSLANTPTRLNMERKRENVPIESFSSVEFSKFPITNAADALRLMPGISIASGPSGKFAVVRGLAERYNPVSLDGIVLPSPDPERQTPQLDIFPSKLLDALVVYKAFKPELPSYSSGGAIDLRTKPFPEARNGQVQFGVKVDEGVFERARFSTYSTNGSRDLLAIGKDDRVEGPAVQVQPNGTRVSYMESDTPLGPRQRRLPVGARASVNFEDRLPLGESGMELAYGLSVAYDSSYSTTSKSDVEVSPGGVGPAFLNFNSAPDTNDYVESTEEVGLGVVGIVGLKLSPEHRLVFSAFRAQSGDDTVSEGIAKGEGGTFGYHQLHYKQRNLTSLRLGGDHVIGSAQEDRLNWRVARVSTSQEEPDFRFVPFEINTSGRGGRFGMVAGGPERRLTRYWRDVAEDSWVGGADYQFTLRPNWANDLNLKLGWLADSTERKFTEKVFYWGGSNFAFSDFIIELPAEMNRRSPAQGFVESNSDVNAKRDVLAPFLDVSTRVLGRDGATGGLNLNAGVQFERYRLSTNGLSQFGNYSTTAFYNANPSLGASVLRTEADGPFGFFRRYFNDQKTSSWLPTAGLVWTARENLIFRLSASKTTARPSFREIGPYYTLDQVTLSSVHGNIALRQSKVENLDFRAEYFFPRSADLVAVSLFSKRVQGAIERVGLEGEFSPRLTDSWINNPNEARIDGVEFEFRKSLQFLGSTWSGFTIGGNGTLIDAKVLRLASELKSTAYRSDRRLYDQPEWIANAYSSYSHKKAGFTATLSMTAISDVLRVANQGFVDEFAKGFSQMNLTMSQKFGQSWTLRASASNLTDPDREVVPDSEYVSSDDSNQFAYSRWREGRSYSLSILRDF